MSARRRRPLRRSKPRPRWTGVAVVLLVVAVALGIAALQAQIRGYFASPQRPKRVTAEQTAAPQPVARPGVESPAPTPSPAATSVSTPKPGAPRLAIIIDDCGYDIERDSKFLTLPIPLTLSVLPMTPHEREIADAAATAGKAIILHIPMEPESSTHNPGPGAIRTGMSDDEVRAQLEADIDSLPGAPGANNHMGSKATSDVRVMRDVMEVLQKDHLFFIDSLTTGATVAGSTARQYGVPTASRDVFLDNTQTVEYVTHQLEQAEAVARKQGEAIAIGHSNDATFETLVALVPRLEEAGINFVTAESLVR